MNGLQRQIEGEPNRSIKNKAKISGKTFNKTTKNSILDSGMANSITIALKLGQGLLVLLLIQLQQKSLVAEPLESVMLSTTSPHTFPFTGMSTESLRSTLSTMPPRKVQKTSKVLPTLSSSSAASTSSSTLLTSPKGNRQDDVIRESVVIPSTDSEREAQELYDKALQQFGSFELSFRKICSGWELRGCKCSGTVDEMTLACRDVGLQEIPNQFPANVVKL